MCIRDRYRENTMDRAPDEEINALMDTIVNDLEKTGWM
jgi:DNA-binding ferritin-like protein